MYSEICKSDKQWRQWRQLGVWGSETNGTVDDLKSNPYLMLDSSLFGQDFQRSLLREIDGLDDCTDGLVISGDNFQALNLLAQRYAEQADCVYIDPPYNTDASAICYKNGYKSSSWLSLMQSRLEATPKLMKPQGVLVAAIDDAQQRELNFLLCNAFASDLLGVISVRSNPSGRPTQSGYAVSHEYLLFAGKSGESKIQRLPPTPAQMARFTESDKMGPFEWRNLRREGSDSDRDARRSMYYPIYVTDTSLRVPRMEWKEDTEEWIPLEQPAHDETVVYPDNENGIQKRWRWEWRTVEARKADVAVRKDRTGKNYVYCKRRPNEEGVVSVSTWADAKHSSTEHGTALLKQLFGVNPFSYPKSIHAVVDSIYIAGASRADSLVIDYFAGSGTTGHAVISLNRRDKGTRRYILAEQGEYFDTILKPRIQKVVFSERWDQGKPSDSSTGISHCFKVLKLESYEDTLNNLQLRRAAKQGETLSLLNQQAQDDYLLNYMLDVESRDSLLSVQDFNTPFDYTLNVAVDSAGAFAPCKIDLVETFNYLIGLRVRHIDAQPERGYVTVTGSLPSGESCLVLWRDCEMLDYEGVSRLCDRLAINPSDNEFDIVYINGDHNIPTVLTQTAEEGGATRLLKLRQIEPEFLQRMFSVEDI